MVCVGGVVCVWGVCVLVEGCVKGVCGGGEGPMASIQVEFIQL